ncbi:MAG: 6,7-dimethyl-8-ribityllumazine synthase [Chthoniobacter sp.]|jgi:6,7-dimethyl-8-ribityllumazine synthase|nr:6,7-dimethyl-8-ribityllumazine synthase [Chthoniobacter sp.]
MSSMLPTRPRQMHQRRAFAIVASEYNGEFVQGLVDFAMRELQELVPGAYVTVYRVPGAFEIPLAVQEAAERGGVDAILALGVIVQGETGHAGLLAEAVTYALLECGMRYRLPVVHQVLLVADEAQARQRCLEPELNRGTEAARVAVRALQALHEVKGR